MDNLEEINRFVEMYHLPRLKQEEIENMNSPITSKKTESLSKTFKTKQNKQSPGPEGFTGEFYQTFKEELIPIFLKLFQK